MKADIFIEYLYLYLYLIDRTLILILGHWKTGKTNWDNGVSMNQPL